MAIVETQQLRMLEQLRHAAEQPIALEQLRAAGIDFPAVVIGELELSGYVIERATSKVEWLVCACLRPNASSPPPHAGATDGAEPSDSHQHSRMPAALSARRVAAEAAQRRRTRCFAEPSRS